MIVVVSGVAGAGKSTLAQALARRLGWPVVEGDDLHPAANVGKMEAGVALDDDDRGPWLTALRGRVEELLERGEPAVVAASLLRASHRAAAGLTDPRVLLVFLDIDPETARRRVADRRGHFFGAELVADQFAALERPEDALVLPAVAPVETLVERVVDHVNTMQGERGWPGSS